MSAPRIVLTHKSDAREYWFGDVALQRLRTLGEVTINREMKILAGSALVDFIGNAAFVVLDRETRLSREDLEALPDLAAILRTGVDCSMVDVEAASNLGILVVAAQPGYIESTAELGMALLLAAARQVPRYDAAFHQGRSCAPFMGTELASATVGILGYGRVGRYLARLLGAFGSTVLVGDPAVDQNEIQRGETLLELDEILERGDFIVLTTAVTAQTRGIIGREVLGRMKSHAWLINLARGELVDEDALEAALVNGTIAGAAMDVGSAPDNIPADRFRGFANVVATPHIGNLTGAGLHRQPINSVANLEKMLNGAMPSTSLNPEHARRLQSWWAAFKTA